MEDNPVGDFLENTKINTQAFLRIPSNESAIKISIEGRELKRWQGLSVVYQMDAATAAVSFTTVFDPDDDDMISLFRPDKQILVDITYDLGITILQGIIDKFDPDESVIGIETKIEARAIVSPLVDSDIIQDVYFKKLTLQQFADKLLGQTGLTGKSVVFEPDSSPIPVIKVEKGEKFFEAIAKEAASLGYWCIPARAGTFTFKKISPNDKIQAELQRGVSPVLAVKGAYSLTNRFSEYVGIGGGNGSSRSVKIQDTSFPPGLFGTKTKLVKAQKENSDLIKFTERARNQDQIDSISLSVDLSSWVYNDKIWQPGGMIQLEAPGAMIYKPFKFVIKTVTLTYDESGEKATLELAFPNAYDGSNLDDYPWIPAPGNSVRGLLPKIRRALGT